MDAGVPKYNDIDWETNPMLHKTPLPKAGRANLGRRRNRNGHRINDARKNRSAATAEGGKCWFMYELSAKFVP